MDSSVLDGGWWSDTTVGNGCSGMHRLTVSRQLATDAVVCNVSQCHDSWCWNALDSRSSEVSVLISGRLRRMVSEVFGKHFGVVYSWSTMSSSFVSCLAWWCIVESQAHPFTVHASAWLKFPLSHLSFCVSFHPHVIHVCLTADWHLDCTRVDPFWLSSFGSRGMIREKRHDSSGSFKQLYLFDGIHYMDIFGNSIVNTRIQNPTNEGLCLSDSKLSNFSCVPDDS